MDESSQDEPPAGADAIGCDVFATTHWSLVMAAGGGVEGVSGRALEALCRSYWFPLYAFARRKGWSPEDAADLTQGFFTRLLTKGVLGFATRDRGRFRSFLLAGMKNFMANEWDREHALKRGGDVERFSLDADLAERSYAIEPVDDRDPAALYDQQWAMKVLESALNRLREEQLAAGKEALFGRLQHFLVGERTAEGYAGAATELGCTEAAVKMSVMRLRARCRELLRAEIARTVMDPLEVDAEYAALVAALRG